ncbi:Dcp1p-Dcp2p decapping enzyme complex alpha subunit [Rhizina undulata]
MPVESIVPEIPGIKAEHQLAQTLRREVSYLLGRDGHMSFAGAQPVSFSAKHINELKQKEFYYLCEKSDGIRCLMYFTRDGPREIHYLIDRKNEYYYVPNLHFPLPEDETFRSFHTETLIDGELVLDDIGNGKKVMKYLVFDCLILEGKSVMERTLDKRLGYFREYVYKPYKRLCDKFPEEVPYFPFQVEFKKMEFSYAVEMMFRQVLPNLPHGNDGLIFTCRTSPYKFGTDEHIIKWKPADINSIDFRLNLEFPLVSAVSDSDSDDDDDDDEESETESLAPDYEAKPTFNLSAYLGDNKYEKWATMYVTDEEWAEFKNLGQPLNDQIVECAMDEQRRWRFMRFRRDKKDANHISTVRSVIESIEDAVGQEELIGAAGAIKGAWKARNAAPAAQAQTRQK